MDRSTFVAKTLAIVAALSTAASLAAQTAQRDQARGAALPQEATARAETRTLTALLDQASKLEPGTYTPSGGSFDPLEDRDRVPVIVQADAMPGPDRTIRAALSLGAQVAQAVVTRARIVAASGPAGAVVTEIAGSSPAGVVRAVNQLTLKPGEYELQAVVVQPSREGPLVASLAKSRLVVPDFWRGTLAVSPLVLGDAVTAAPASSRGTPFVFGPTALRPAAGERFPRSGDLHVAFRVFNWTAQPQEKPDLTVEYVFYERTPTRAQFFNKVKPQRLNGDTLGERFDAASGVVNGGVSVPLAAFPFGEFQLTVRVTDNRTKQTVSQETRFTVVP
jgi:hypothetical protein